MKKPLRKALSLLTTLALTCSMSAAAFAADPDSTGDDYDGWNTIKVFETTDVHGYITDISSFDESTFQYRMAYLAKVFNDARADEAYDDVLLLDSGDIFQGTPHSNLTYGAALRAAMDIMKYDAVSLGNHEFDWDVTLYGGDKDGTMAAYEIGAFKGDSNIPVLAYNLYDAGTTNRADFVRDYAVVEKAGYTVAILGYVPDYSPDIMAAKIAPYDIDEDLTKLAAKAEEVRSWDSTAYSPYVTYTGEDGKRYQVWYEDERSVAEKVKLARMFGVNGISLWRLGIIPDYTDPGLDYNVWAVLQRERGRRK